MKRIVLSVFASILVFSAGAQVGTLTLRAKGKALAPASFETFYINGDTASILVEQNASSVNARYELVRMDMNQKVQATARYRREDGRYYLDGFDNPQSVDLLVCEHDSKANTLKTFHERRDPRTLEVMGTPRQLHSMSGMKKDLVTMVYRSSPDQQLQDCIYVLKREGEGAEASVALYSREYEEYWTMSTRLHALDFALVSDSGEVIVGGWGQKKDSYEAVFEVNVLDGEKDETYSFECNEGRLMEVHFGGYSEGRVQLFAIVREDGNKGNGSQVDRLLALCFNTKTGKLSQEVHRLTSQEINRLCNNDDGSRAGSAVQFLQIDGVCTAPDGHYDVLMSQLWTEVDQYGLPNAHFMRGLLVATVDADGHFTRFHARHMNTGVPMNQMSMNRPRLMRTKGGSIMFYMQHAASADRPQSESTKRYQPALMNGVMTAVFFPDEGQPVSQNFELPKYGIYGLPKRVDDKTFLIFFRNLTKSQVGVFKVK